MESPNLSDPKKILSETFGLTLEEFDQAEKEFEGLDENIRILLTSAVVYTSYEPKKHMINHLKIWKKRLLVDLSEESIDLAFTGFEESIFVETNEKNNVKNYKIREKYISFIKKTKTSFIQKIQNSQA